MSLLGCDEPAANLAVSDFEALDRLRLRRESLLNLCFLVFQRVVSGRKVGLSLLGCGEPAANLAVSDFEALDRLRLRRESLFDLSLRRAHFGDCRLGLGGERALRRRLLFPQPFDKLPSLAQRRVESGDAARLFLRDGEATVARDLRLPQHR